MRFAMIVPGRLRAGRLDMSCEGSKIRGIFARDGVALSQVEEDPGDSGDSGGQVFDRNHGQWAERSLDSPRAIHGGAHGSKEVDAQGFSGIDQLHGDLSRVGAGVNMAKQEAARQAIGHRGEIGDDEVDIAAFAKRIRGVARQPVYPESEAAGEMKGVKPGVTQFFENTAEACEIIRSGVHSREEPILLVLSVLMACPIILDTVRWIRNTLA